jgi:hypothetical protein
MLYGIGSDNNAMNMTTYTLANNLQQTAKGIIFTMRNGEYTVAVL